MLLVLLALPRVLALLALPELPALPALPAVPAVLLGPFLFCRAHRSSTLSGKREIGTVQFSGRGKLLHSANVLGFKKLRLCFWKRTQLNSLFSVNFVIVSWK